MRNFILWMCLTLVANEVQAAWAVADSGALYTIRSKSSGLYLDNPGWSTSDGTGIVIYPHQNGNANQQWLFEKRPSGGVSIINAFSAKCLDNAGSATEPSSLIQYYCKSGANQSFALVPVSNDEYEIRLFAKDLCLDVPGWSTDPNTAIGTWYCNGQDNQRWVFEQAVAARPGATQFAIDSSQLRLPLQTSGRYVVDQDGTRIKLIGVNWYGANDVNQVVGGLGFAPIDRIIETIKQMRFNAVRLPFSNQMLNHRYPNQAWVPPWNLAANPELIGKTPLEVFDFVVEKLTRAGLMVILNNHTLDSRPCCQRFDENQSHNQDQVWFNDWFSFEDWLADWRFVAQRYAHNKRVIGADLYNEPRLSKFGMPRWSDAQESQLNYAVAMTEAGNQIHQVNPHVLIIVEALDGIWEHFDLASDLRQVREQPIVLNQPNKVVYSPHAYPFLRGPHGYGATHYGNFESDLDQAWGYLVKENLAPVWVGEFGVGYTADHELDQKRWLGHFTRYLAQHDIGWAWWPLNGGTKPASDEIEYYGLLDFFWWQPRHDWRTNYLEPIKRVKTQ